MLGTIIDAASLGKEESVTHVLDSWSNLGEEENNGKELTSCAKFVAVWGNFFSRART